MVHVSKSNSVKFEAKIDAKLEALNHYLQSSDKKAWDYQLPARFNFSWFADWKEKGLEKVSRSNARLAVGEPLKEQILNRLADCQRKLEGADGRVIKKLKARDEELAGLKTEVNDLKARNEGLANTIIELMNEVNDLKAHRHIDQQRWNESCAGRKV